MSRSSISLFASAVFLTALASPVRAEQRQIAFNIPAGNLQTALDAYVRQSGLELVYRVEEVERARSRGYVGQQAPDYVLEAILAGTGFSVRRNASGALAIIGGPDGATAGSQNIIVTAGKRPEKLSDVPTAINVVTKEGLDNRAANKLADYIGYLPNVALIDQGATGYARVYIRGITVIGSGSTVGTYIDGMPFGSSTGFASAASLQPDLDPSVLQQVEVLKGPQGTLYGSGSTGGLIKYTTAAPDAGSFSGGASLEGASIGHGGSGYGARAHVNVPLITEVMAVRLSGYSRKDAGFIDNLASGKKDENDTVSRGFDAVLLATPTPDLSIRLSALYQYLRGDGINSVTTQPGPEGSTKGEQGPPLYGRYSTMLYGDPGNYARDGLYGADIEYALSFATLTSVTSYSNLRGQFSTGDNGYVASDYGIEPTDIVDTRIGGRTNKVAQEMRLASKDPAAAWQWLLGGFFTHENSTGSMQMIARTATGAIDETVAPGGDVYTRTVPSDYTEWSAFANSTLKVLPSLSISLGGRFSAYEQHYRQIRSGQIGNATDPGNDRLYADARSSDHAFTYVAAIKYGLPHGLLYARSASGYRVGGPSILPPGATPPADFTGKFKPEKLYNYEVGYRQSFVGDRISIDLSAFFIDYHDMQGNVAVGRFIYTGNPGNATSKGLELVIQAKPVSGLVVNGAIGYAKATLNEDSTDFGALKGDTLPNAPRWTASGSIDYIHPISGDLRAFVNVGIRYISSQIGGFSSTEEITFPSSTVADLQLGVRNHTLSASFFVKNLTNIYKYDGDVRPSESGPALLAVTVPRTFGIRFSQEF